MSTMKRLLLLTLCVLAGLFGTSCVPNLASCTVQGATDSIFNLSSDRYDEHITGYKHNRDVANTGMGVAFAGGVVLGAAIPIAIIGKRRAQGAGLHKANTGT
jgi:hypothetical protein